MAFFDHVKLFFGADVSGITRGTAKAKKEVRGLSAEVAKFKRSTMNAFGAGAIGTFTAKVLKSNSALFDQAKMVGLTAEKMQEVNYALGQNSARFEDFRVSLAAVARNRKAALEGNERLVNSFEKLGITLDDLQDLTRQEIFFKVSENVKTLGGDIKGLEADLLGAMGETAIKLVPTMAAGFKEAGDRARELGMVVDELTVNALKLTEGEFAEALTMFFSKTAPIVNFLSNSVLGAVNLAQFTASATKKGLSNLSKDVSPLIGQEANWTRFTQRGAELGQRIWGNQMNEDTGINRLTKTSESMDRTLKLINDRQAKQEMNDE